MIIYKEQYGQLYEGIKSDFPSSEDKKLIIFVSAAECDSVCALRLLTIFLKADNVYHSVFPVTTYSEIQTICQTQLANNEDFKNVLLINCGARESVIDLLQLTQVTRVTVIDSHRPIHPHYKRRDDVWQNIILLHNDHDTNIDDIPDEMPSDSEGEGDSGSDSEDDVDADALQRPAQRQRTSTDQWRETRRRSRRERQVLARKYEEYMAQGAHWGRPAACTVLELATDALCLQAPESHLLWLAIVGLTDHLVHQRLPTERYNAYLSELQAQVSDAADEAAEEEGLIAIEDEEGEMINTTARKLLYGKITEADDFRFGLARHWTLYDAMMHSAFVAVRMQTWHDKGRRQLEELLAKMGFKLKECKQDSGTSCGRVILRELPVKLGQHAASYKLTDVMFRSFQLTWESSSLMASDAVYAITALLESPASRQGPEDTCSDRLWRAYNALAMRDNGELKQGLDMAKKLQRAILSDGGLAMVRKAVKATAAYRVLDMRRMEVGNKVLLSQPLALAKLGMFVRDVYAWREPSKRMGMVIVGTANSEGNCLVVGITPPPGVGALQCNKFGDLFREVAQSMHAAYRHDTFDSSVIEVAEPDLDNFLRDLQHAVTD